MPTTADAGPRRRPATVRLAAGSTAVVSAALLAGGAAAGPAGAAVAAVVVAGAVAWGWPALLALPSPRGTTAVVAAAAVAAVAVVAATPDEPALRRLPVVMGLAVLAACAHELLRRDLRPRVVDSLGGTVLGAGVAASAAGWVALAGERVGGPLLPALLAGAVASLVLVAPLPVAAGVGAALAAGAGTGALVAAVAPSSGGTGAVDGAVVGLVAGLVVVGLHRVLAPLPTAGRARSQVALVAGQLAVGGTAAHLVGQFLTG